MSEIKLGVTAAVTNDAGDILLGKKSRAFTPSLVGKWVTPGGRVHFNERLTDAIKREVREETGIDIEIAGILTVCELMQDKEHFVFVVFDAEPIDESQIPVGGDDLEDAKWFSEEEIVEMITAKKLTPITEQIVRAEYDLK